MAEFSVAQLQLAAEEGGWCDKPNDRGGETNRGWSMLSICRFGIPPSELGLTTPWGDDTWAPFGIGCATILQKIYDGWRAGRSTQTTLHALQAGLDPAKNEAVGPGRGILKPLTQTASDAAYLKHFWTPNHFGEITDQRVATKIYSNTVLTGPGAIKLAQQAVNGMGGQLVDDGQIGQHTIDALNGEDPQAFIDAYSDALVAHYRAVVAATPSDADFLPNWIHRANWQRTPIAP